MIAVRCCEVCCAAAPPPRSNSHAPLTVRSVDVRACRRISWRHGRTSRRRALEPNAYLSPHFVLPAVRHLDPASSVFALMVERQQAPGAPRKLEAVLICQPTLGTKTFPVPHLHVYRSLHSFLTGVLVDRDQPDEALGALLDHIEDNRWRWGGLEFDTTWGDGPVHDALIRLCRARRNALPRVERGAARGAAPARRQGAHPAERGR